MKTYHYLIFLMFVGCVSSQSALPVRKVTSTDGKNEIVPNKVNRRSAPNNQPSPQKKPVKPPPPIIPIDAPKELPYPEEVNTTGPIDDCLMQSSLYARSEGLDSQCTLNYVHFYPAKVKKEKPPAQVKIGSFNLFHLGDTVAPMKNLGLMAQIINQWDVVGVQELMPLVSKWRMSNRGVFQALQKMNVHALDIFARDWAVVSPGYIKLLKELRQLDPSWAIILQPQPDGEGSTGEMAGFFYRSKYVQLKELSYCPRARSMDVKSQAPLRNLACLMQVPVLQRKLISRTAFAAYFEVGNFDFVGLSTHVRFNKSLKLADRKAQEKEICAQHENPSKCSISQDEVGRFYEVKVVADQIAKIKKYAGDNDVIYMGDYNLEINDKSTAFWDAALKSSDGHSVYQSDLSTLTIKFDGLASNYDHFIFNSADTDECDSKNIHTFDYTPVLKSEQENEVMAAVAESLSEENKKIALDKLTAEINLLIKQKGSEIISLTDKERAELIKKNERALARMKQNTTGALLELLSDHLPIELTCYSDKKAD